MTEDLGGGLKAIARLESDFNAVQFKANTGVASSDNKTATANSINSVASTFGNGEVWAGLSGGFGSIKFGSVNFNTLTSTGTIQPFGTAVGSGYTAVLRGDAAGSTVRDENQLNYITPALNGFTGVVNYSRKQTKAKDGATASTSTGLVSQQSAYSGTLGAYDKMGSQEIGLNYVNGPITATYSSLKQDLVDVSGIGTNGVQVAGTTATTVTTMGGNYAMGAAKLFLGNQAVKTTTGAVATDTSYTTYGATYASGKTTYQLAMGSLKQDVGANAGKKSTLTGIGVKYDLSKTTSAYLRHESIKDEAKVIASAATLDGTDTKRTRTAIGISVGF